MDDFKISRINRLRFRDFFLRTSPEIEHLFGNEIHVYSINNLLFFPDENYLNTVMVSGYFEVFDSFKLGSLIKIIFNKSKHQDKIVKKMKDQMKNEEVFVELKEGESYFLIPRKNKKKFIKKVMRFMRILLKKEYYRGDCKIKMFENISGHAILFECHTKQILIPEQIRNALLAVRDGNSDSD